MLPALLASLLFTAKVEGVTHVITVENFQFSPKNFTVNVGDTIRWQRDDSTGSISHTTTSDVIPAGAASWDSPISQNNPSYTYVVTVAGTYNYVCTPHAAMGMVGSFVASPASGTDQVGSAPFFQLNGNIVADGLVRATYNLQKAGNLHVQLFTSGGYLVADLENRNRPAGYFTAQYEVPSLPAGLYFIRAGEGNSQFTYRLYLR